MSLHATFVAALLTLLAVVGLADETAKATKMNFDFEGDRPGQSAQGFTAAVGTWRVVETSQGKVLAQTAENPDDTFNVILADAPRAKDLDLSVKFKAISGKNDQGGGLVWRARDAKNYYVARFNPLEDNFRVYKVVEGKRTMFQSADVKLQEGRHTLRVVMVGAKIGCELDGKRWLEVEDSTFTEAGQVGLWTKSDAHTEFDDLTLSEPAKP